MQTIDIFPWNDQFETGLDLVDKQHKKLVEILNKLASHIASNSSEEELNDIFDELTNYTIYHFETEEAIWHDFVPNDPLDDDHKAIHKQFVDTVLKLKREQSSRPLIELAEEALDFLARWLASHILETDRYMAYLIFALKDGLAIEEAKQYAKEKMGGSTRLLINIILSIYGTLSLNTLHLMRELKIHQDLDKQIDNQDKYRNLLLDISTVFINLPLDEIDLKINEVLEKMANFVRADRAYIFDYNFRQEIATNTHEWCGLNIVPQIDELQETSISLIPEWPEIHSKGEYILIQDVNALEKGPLRDILVQQKIQSIVTFPLFENSKCVGFVGFDLVKTKRKLTLDEIGILELFSKLLSNVAERRHKEESLELNKKRFESAEQIGNVGNWEYNIDTNEFWVSEQTKSIYGLPKDTNIFSRKLIEDSIVERERVGKALNNLIEKGDEYNLEFEIKPYDGSNSKIISSLATLDFDDSNKPLKIIGFIQDVTELKQIQKELEIEKNRFALAVEGSQDGLWDWNLQTNELFFGKRFEIMLGYTPGTLENNASTWYNLLHPDDVESSDKVVQDYLKNKGKGHYECTFRLLAKDGSWKWILGRGKAQFDKKGTPLRFIGFNTDITEKKEYEKRLDHIAKYDSLTNLPNRFLLSELLTHSMNITKRNQKQLALLFIDLDGFKEVNDSYGHQIGDLVLSTIASRMNSILRDSDIVSRIGGDEFIIVITDIGKSKDVIPLLQRLLSDIALDINYKRNIINVSASIGVSLYPQHLDIGNEVLIRQADQAMYNAKSLGKNQYQFFNIEASVELKQNQDNIQSLINGIYTNQFVVYYQPKVDMRNNKIVGIEALLRWNHPKKGLLYPDQFLPIIEQDSIIMIELGKWVFENVFAEIELWSKNGLNIKVSINVSSHEVQRKEFSVDLANLFKKYPYVKPSNIEIEILETAAFSDFTHTSKVLQECKKLGISIAIDDFGTGYASLQYLKQLPMDTIKIDKSFVLDLLHTSSSLSIIEASIGLSDAFNTNVIAEGIESEEHGKILLQIGCTIAQGYIISKAMPAKEVIKWISSYKGFSSWENIKPINDYERTVLYSSIEHKGWIKSIEDFLNNKNKKLPQLDGSKCHLGKWIIDSELTTPNFLQLESLHNELHNYAKELLLLNTDARKEGIEKLKNLGNKISEVLNSIIFEKESTK